MQTGRRKAGLNLPLIPLDLPKRTGGSLTLTTLVEGEHKEALPDYAEFPGLSTEKCPVSECEQRSLNRPECLTLMVHL